MMLYKLICVIFLVVEVKVGADVPKSVFSYTNLPNGFDDDDSFEKSGFMPEFDFSHFFRRVDFDRGLNEPISHPGIEQRNDVNMPAFDKHTPLTIRSNVEEQSERYRRLTNPTTYQRQPSFQGQNSKYFLHPESPIPSRRERKTLESRSFDVGSRSPRGDEFVRPAFEVPSRFQRNLPLHNVPELNPPFGKDGEHFMQFLSQLSSNNRPFGDNFGFGQKSDFIPSEEVVKRVDDNVNTYLDDNNYIRKRNPYQENELEPGIFRGASFYDFGNTREENKHENEAVNANYEGELNLIRQHNQTPPPSINIEHNRGFLAERYNNKPRIHLFDSQWATMSHGFNDDKHSNKMILPQDRRSQVAHHEYSSTHPAIAKHITKHNVDLSSLHELKKMQTSFKKNHDEDENATTQKEIKGIYPNFNDKDDLPHESPIKEPNKRKSLLKSREHLPRFRQSSSVKNDYDRENHFTNPVTRPRKTRKRKVKIPITRKQKATRNHDRHEGTKLNTFYETTERNFDASGNNQINGIFQESTYNPRQFFEQEQNKFIRFPEKGQEQKLLASAYNPNEFFEEEKRKFSPPKDAFQSNTAPYKLKTYRQPIGSKPISIETNSVYPTSRSYPKLEEAWVEHVYPRRVITKNPEEGSITGSLVDINSKYRQPEPSKSPPTSTSIAATPSKATTRTTTKSTRPTASDVTSSSAVTYKFDNEDIVTTAKPPSPYTPGPVYYKDIPAVTPTSDPEVILDEITAPVLFAVPPAVVDNTLYTAYHDDPKPALFDNRQDTAHYAHYQHEERPHKDLDGGYYYRDINYQNHPETDIDENPDNDWIPIDTRQNRRKDGSWKSRLANSPLKKLVNTFRQKLFNEHTNLEQVTALFLPYTALALPARG